MYFKTVRFFAISFFFLSVYSASAMESDDNPRPKKRMRYTKEQRSELQAEKERRLQYHKLIEAIEKGDLDELRRLVDEEKIPLKRPNGQWFKSIFRSLQTQDDLIMVACKYDKMGDIAEYLVRKDPSILDDDHIVQTLVGALRGENISVLRKLFEFGADASRLLLDSRGQGLLEIERTLNRGGRVNFWNFLLAKGQLSRAILDDEKKYGTTLFHIFADAGRIDLLKLLSRYGDIGKGVVARDKGARTPLHVACSSNRDEVEVVSYLIENGADPNVQDNEGKNSLHYAAQNWRGEVVDGLLDAGADPNMQDNEGKNSLHYAAQSMSGEVVVARLLNAGADPNVLDHNNRRPFSYYLAKAFCKAHVTREVITGFFDGGQKEFRESNGKNLLHLLADRGFDSKETCDLLKDVIFFNTRRSSAYDKSRATLKQLCFARLVFDENIENGVVRIEEAIKSCIDFSDVLSEQKLPFLVIAYSPSLTALKKNMDRIDCLVRYNLKAAVAKILALFKYRGMRELLEQKNSAGQKPWDRFDVNPRQIFPLSTQRDYSAFCDQDILSKLNPGSEEYKQVQHEAKKKIHAIRKQEVASSTQHIYKRLQ